MESERAKHQSTIHILKKTLSNFTSMLTLSEEQRGVFEKKMTDFIENNQQRFEHLNEVLSQSTTHIGDTTERYTEATNAFHHLLNQQKQLVNKLETAVEQFDVLETPTPPTVQSTEAPIRFGLFAEKTPVAPVLQEEPAHDSEIKVF